MNDTVTGPVVETDVVVIGAGPAGLFAAFELGLQELGAHIVDALPFAGGQCVELYPDKPIYDIPGIRHCTGRELVERLLVQIRPFAPGLHLDQTVDRLEPLPDGRFALATSAGTRFVSRAVVIASGAGAFLPRKPALPGLERFEDDQVLYRVPDDAHLAGEDVVVSGDGDLALEAANRLAALEGADRPRSVTLVHRRDSFRAAEATVARTAELRAAGRLAFMPGQFTALVADAPGDRLAGLALLGADGATHTLAASRFLILQGLSPRLGPITEWGLALERKQLVVDTATFRTSAPGIHAIGDAVTYPGKRKLILCGFHEATLAAFGIAGLLLGGEPVHLQYTTTSPRLHELLGADGSGRGD